MKKKRQKRKKRELVDYHFLKGLPFESKSIIEIELLPTFIKTPLGEADFDSILFQVRTDAAVDEVPKEKIKAELVTHLSNLLDERGYETECRNWAFLLWVDPASFAGGLCSIMEKNGFGFNWGIFKKAKRCVERTLFQSR